MAKIFRKKRSGGAAGASVESATKAAQAIAQSLADLLPVIEAI